MEEKNQPQTEPKQDSDFMKERIKERPLNKKKLARRTIVTAAMAVLFALIACLVFTILEPLLSNWIYPEEEPQVVEFPEDVNEILPEEMLTDKEEEQQDNSPSYEETEGIVDQQLTQMFANFQLDVDDYKTLYTALGQVANEAEKALVTVTGVKNDVDWFDNVYQSKGQTSGVIIGNNGKQLLILSQESVTEHAETILINFTDGSVSVAELKQSDPNTGLAVFAVELENLSKMTQNSIRIAELGSSNGISLPGSPVIAIGSPMGTAGSVSYGMITAAGTAINLVDNNFKILTTNIYGSTGATGVIINLKGQILGIIDNSYNDSDMKNLISAIGVSELKQVVEKLSNGIPIAYLGVHGTDVPEQANKRQGVPYGAYVTSIEMGSPAMNAGIQSGDVIVQFGESPIMSMSDLTKALYKVEPESTVNLVIERRGQDEYREMEISLDLGVFE